VAQASLRHLRAASPPANIRWHEGSVERPDRWLKLGQRGATVWFTGLSGAGKSTIAAEVEQRLLEQSRWAYRLDGDNLRHGVCADLGFEPEDRAENARRVAELAILFADAGAVALVCLVSPYAADRHAARELHEQAGIEFVEVFVNTSLRECMRRDTKGLYRQAHNGTLTNLTGIGAPYEAPRRPELELTEDLDVAGASARVLAALPALRS
jgi:adenylyl-sulfate kinase